MMTKNDKERFNKRICGEVEICAAIRISDLITEGAAYVTVTELSLYERICQYALQHGEDLQGMFNDDKYGYMSCFIRDVAAFRTTFENEALLKPLFNHDKGDTVEFVISVPEERIEDYGDIVRKEFVDIIQNHVITINNKLWKKYVTQAMTGATLCIGFDITGKTVDPEDERDTILRLSRQDFVKTTTLDSFEPYYYVERLLSGAKEIGNINGFKVWFNERGFYFYWNEETEFLIESWLTFPAYPYGWFK
ncbi:hypothetical protein L6N65_004462 [Escherichia coli]|nr:hypothetical protein [Escherichia coli]EIV8348682.1 hypothetical protein [Escherichia coli]HAV8655486.1 hypothetical protein [Escherichia coli]HAW8242476.1 hypothetical protein [Escherichia coli]